MIRHSSLVAIAAVLSVGRYAAPAEDNLKVGIIATLSGPAGGARPSNYATASNSR